MTDEAAANDDAPLLVVDSANVVGSVPDGWWRDRVGATTRLRDVLAALAGRPLGDRVAAGGPDWLRERPAEIVLVVEGAAREVAGADGVRVVSAEGSGDDAIVAVVADAAGRCCAVVTADRELGERVRALGATVVGPRTVYP